MTVGMGDISDETTTEKDDDVIITSEVGTAKGATSMLEEGKTEKLEFMVIDDKWEPRSVDGKPVVLSTQELAVLSRKLPVVETPKKDDASKLFATPSQPPKFTPEIERSSERSLLVTPPQPPSLPRREGDVMSTSAMDTGEPLKFTETMIDSVLTDSSPADYELPRDHPWPTDFLTGGEAAKEDAWKRVWRDDEMFEELGCTDVTTLLKLQGACHYFEGADDGYTVSGGCGHLSKGREFHFCAEHVNC